MSYQIFILRRAQKELAKDEDFVKKLIEENKMSSEEEQKILSKWLKT